MAIRIFRYGFEKAVRHYTLVNKSVIEINLPEPYLIVIEETKNLESTISLKIKVPKGNTLNYEINVLKYWEYDFGKLYEENKYLLYPLQLFKYRKHMEKINRRKNTENKERAISELNNYRGLSEEVKKMVRSFYDPEVEERGKKEGIIEGILEFLQEVGGSPSNIATHINKEEDIEKLKIWLKLAARSKSISEFEENM